MVPCLGYRRYFNGPEADAAGDVRVMMVPSQDRTDCLVVGAGALGLLLAASLKKSVQIGKKKCRVAVLNRRRPPSRVIVHLPDQGCSDLASCVDIETPDWFLNEPAVKVIFFCLPPESTEPSFIDFFEKTKNLLSQSKDVFFIFCNNGCLSENITHIIESDPEKFHAVRALFFIGSVRECHADEWQVRWTGGRRAAWNTIADHSSGGIDQINRLLKSLSFETVAGDRFVDWDVTPKIKVMERKKFFTNFMLAAGIGRTRTQNKNLYSCLSSGTLETMAAQFATLWHLEGVTADELTSVLNATVAATGENFNSLSLAAVNGNDMTMRWFLDCLTFEVSRSAQHADLEALKHFLEAVRDDWGIAHE